MLQIEFYKECGDDNRCDAELSVEWLEVSGVVVGSQSARAQVNASLRVYNTGETAYAVTLNVTFPRPSLQFAAAAPEHLVCYQFFADRTARTMIGSWHHNIVCPSVRPFSLRLSVCPSVALCIVARRVGVEGQKL